MNGGGRRERRSGATERMELKSLSTQYTYATFLKSPGSENFGLFGIFRQHSLILWHFNFGFGSKFQ